MQGTRHLQLKLEVTRSVTYCSLAFSSLQQLLDFFFPEAGAALQLPVLCHVNVHHAQESICILLQLGCLPLKHKDGITALGGLNVTLLFTGNCGKQRWMLVPQPAAGAKG